MTEQLAGGGRVFDTGATRDVDEEKFDYEGFLCPYVMEEFGAYMHGKRAMSDGSTRASDNWQKGIPCDVYVKSLLRHVHAIWKGHREGTWSRDDCMAALFNLQGFAHEQLKAERVNAEGERCFGGEVFDEMPVQDREGSLEGLGSISRTPINYWQSELPVAPWEDTTEVELPFQTWRHLYAGFKADQEVGGGGYKYPFIHEPYVHPDERLCDVPHEIAETIMATNDLLDPKNYSEIAKGYVGTIEIVTPEMFEAQLAENKRIDEATQPLGSHGCVRVTDECPKKPFVTTSKWFPAEDQRERIEKIAAEKYNAPFETSDRDKAAELEILAETAAEYDVRLKEETLERLVEAGREFRAAEIDHANAVARVNNPRAYLDPTTARVYGAVDEDF